MEKKCGIIKLNPFDVNDWEMNLLKWQRGNQEIGCYFNFFDNSHEIIDWLNNWDDNYDGLEVVEFQNYQLVGYELIHISTTKLPITLVDWLLKIIERQDKKISCLRHECQK